MQGVKYKPQRKTNWCSDSWITFAPRIAPKKLKPYRKPQRKLKLQSVIIYD